MPPDLARRAARLICLDHAEDNLFAIQRELLEDRHVHPTALAAVLADCKEEERMREVFAEHRPTVVFHAAAYKHVGLMEANPVEAVRNNAIATRVVARVAGEGGTRAFVLVSTDKAVAPATVMGASKALAEWARRRRGRSVPGNEVRHRALRQRPRLLGIVVPIFRRQIARGGPVTVTDDRMTRFFMTIPEAVQLIIRAGSLGDGGEVFVLDMGEPVNIRDLATRDDRALRARPRGRTSRSRSSAGDPGEKLHEQLFNPDERPQPTPAERILRAERPPLRRRLDEAFAEIGLLVLEGDAAALAAKVAELGPVPRPTCRRTGPAASRRPSSMAPSMTWGIAAISVSDQIEKYGAYAGLAAIVGLAVLSLLYFAQAREVKRLREWAGRAPERAAELEARVAADASRKTTVGAAPQTAAAQAATGTAAPASPAAPGAAKPAVPGAPAATPSEAKPAAPVPGLPVPVPAAGAPGTAVAPAAAAGTAETTKPEDGKAPPTPAPATPAGTNGVTSTPPVAPGPRVPGRPPPTSTPPVAPVAPTSPTTPAASDTVRTPSRRPRRARCAAARPRARCPRGTTPSPATRPRGARSASSAAPPSWSPQSSPCSS